MSPVAPTRKHRCRVALLGSIFFSFVLDLGGDDTTEVHPKCLTWLRCGWVGGWEGQFEGNCTKEIHHIIKCTML